MCSRIRAVLPERVWLWSTGQEMVGVGGADFVQICGGKKFQMWWLSLTVVGGANTCMLLIYPLP